MLQGHTQCEADNFILSQFCFPDIFFTRARTRACKHTHKISLYFWTVESSKHFANSYSVKHNLTLYRLKENKELSKADATRHVHVNGKERHGPIPNARMNECDPKQIVFPISQSHFLTLSRVLILVWSVFVFFFFNRRYYSLFTE